MWMVCRAAGICEYPLVDFSGRNNKKYLTFWCINHFCIVNLLVWVFNSIFVKTNVPKRVLYSFAIPRNHDEIELSSHVSSYGNNLKSSPSHSSKFKLMGITCGLCGFYQVLRRFKIASLLIIYCWTSLPDRVSIEDLVPCLLKYL